MLLGQRQRARLRRARQHERELLAPEPRRHVGLAGRRAQEVAKRRSTSSPAS